MKKIILSSLLFIFALCVHAQKDTVIKTIYRLNGVSSWAHDQISEIWNGLHLEWVEAVRCDTGIITTVNTKSDSILSVFDTDTSLTIHARIIDDNQWSPNYYSMLWLGKYGSISVLCANQHARRIEAPLSYNAICVTMHFSKHECANPKFSNKKIISVTLNLKSYVLLDTSVQFESRKCGIGFDAGIYTGLFLPYGTAQASIKGGGVVNMGLYMSYKKFHFSYRLMGTDGIIKDTLAFDPRWVKGNSLQSFSNELSIGYELLNKKRFNIIPTASAGVISFSNNKDTVNIAKTPSYFCWSAGIAFDIKFNSRVKNGYRYPGYEHAVRYWNLRILPGIRPGFFNQPFGMNSGIYFISATFGGYGKGIRRKK